jgi:CheY-like chemotaxis protein
MFSKEWGILLVDDDPEVLEVSKLAMRNFEVYGIPLKIYTAASKNEAVHVLKSLAAAVPGATNLTVAFIDVVMESDVAGLELCEYIREVMQNKTIQIYVRTGQPGLAPERNVIDRYDINGYFTKVEATEEKLYTLVKTGVRQALYIGTALILSQMLNAISAAENREYMAQIVKYFNTNIQLTASGERFDTLDVQSCYIADGVLIAGKRPDQQDQLMQMNGLRLSADGDRYVTDNNCNLMIKVSATNSCSELYYFAKTLQSVPEVNILLFYRFLKSFAALWKQRDVKPIDTLTQ